MSIAYLIKQLTDLKEQAEYRSHMLVEDGREIPPEFRARSEGYVCAYDFCILMLKEIPDSTDELDWFVNEVDLIDSYAGTPTSTWETLVREAYTRFHVFLDKQADKEREIKREGHERAILRELLKKYPDERIK